MSVYEKLMKVQSDIHAPKSNYNSFAKFNYRSLEDITEALKPVLNKYGATVILTDSVEVIGDRHYMKCTASFFDCETGESISNTAYARESNEKKGMDDAQVSGMASSYCRKYCLNGLLLLDDVKDADTNEAHVEKEARAKAKSIDKKEEQKPLTDKEKELIKSMVEKKGYKVEEIFPKGIDAIPPKKYADTCQQLAGLKAKGEK